MKPFNPSARNLTSQPHFDMSEVKNIPRLRFSEFEDKWTSCIVDDIFDVNDGTHQTPKYVSEGIPFVSVESIKDLYSTKKFITEDAFEKEYKIKPKKDDIPMTRITAGIIGDTAIVMDDNPLAYYVSLALLRKKTDSDVNFHEQRINTSIFKKELHKRIIHVAFPKKINLGDNKKCSFSFPSLNEQQKIADFLTSVDKRIELLEKKNILLETYKKGVLKKIFNQEIRFKDDNGNEFPDWEEKRLGEVGEFKTSSVDKKLDDDEQEIFLVNYMNVYRHEKITNENKYDLMVVTAKPNQIDSNNLIKGDILFTPSSETPDDIGHSVVIFEDLDNTLYSYHLLRFRPMIKIDILYSHYFCNNDLVLNQICRFATGSTRFTISKDSFSKILISLPCFEEQSKIAKFLDSIDKQLELLETQIDKSKTWKKGLLQKMFV